MRLAWLWQITGGLACAPIGAVLGLLIVYVVLATLGTTEHEGRRGLMAGVFGVIPGMVLGFTAGYQIVGWTNFHLPQWRGVAAGLATGLLFAMVLLIAGLLQGAHWAEARGVPYRNGAQFLWGLWHVALPAAATGATGGYFLGRSLSAS